MKTKFLYFLVLMFMLPACSTVKYVKFNVLEGATQSTALIAGLETVYSTKEYYVSLAPYESQTKPSGKQLFVIYFENRSAEPITFGPENVNVTVFSSSPSWDDVEIKVMDYYRLMQEIDELEEAKRMTAKLVGAMNALNSVSSSYSHSVTQSSGTIYGSSNTYAYSGTSYTTS
jgi:hypothetical protein